MTGAGGVSPDPNPAAVVSEAIVAGMEEQCDFAHVGLINAHVSWPKVAGAVLEALAAAGFAVVRVPTVAYKGPNDTEASIFSRAAWNLDNGYPVGGSNVSRAVSRILRAVSGEQPASNESQTKSKFEVGGLPVGEEADK